MGTEVKEQKLRKATELRTRRATLRRQTSYAMSKRRKTSKEHDGGVVAGEDVADMV